MEKKRAKNLIEFIKSHESQENQENQNLSQILELVNNDSNQQQNKLIYYVNFTSFLRLIQEKQNNIINQLSSISQIDDSNSNIIKGKINLILLCRDNLKNLYELEHEKNIQFINQQNIDLAEQLDKINIANKDDFTDIIKNSGFFNIHNIKLIGGIVDFKILSNNMVKDLQNEYNNSANILCQYTNISNQSYIQQNQFLANINQYLDHLQKQCYQHNLQEKEPLLDNNIGEITESDGGGLYGKNISEQDNFSNHAEFLSANTRSEQVINDIKDFYQQNFDKSL